MLTIGFVLIFCVVACFTLLFFPEYQYHLGRGHIGASMKTKLYHLLEQRSSTWYLFINFELLVAHFSSTSEFSDLILFILQLSFCYSFVEGKWIHYYVHARLVLSYLVDIGIMINLVIFFVILPINLAISATNIPGFDHS